MKIKICLILAGAYFLYAMGDAGAANVKTSMGERAAVLQSI